MSEAKEGIVGSKPATESRHATWHWIVSRATWGWEDGGDRRNRGIFPATWGWDRRRVACGLRASALAVLATLGAGPASALADDGAADTQRVLVVTPTAPTAAGGNVTAVGGTVAEALPAQAGVVADVPNDAVAALNRRPGVAVVPDPTLAVADIPDQDSLATIFPTASGATRAWHKSGRKGSGITVAVVDSGVAETPDLADRIVAHVAVNPAFGIGDGLGHGTAVAGLIAGSSDDGRYQGVAPEAKIVDVKVTDDMGVTDALTVMRGLRWIYKNADDYGIKVVNISLGATTPSSYRSDMLDAAVEKLWRRGIVVVAAAGNSGSAPGATSHAPGNDPFVITAGATDDRGTASVADDTVAPFSSVGTTLDGIVKPELYAPGVRLPTVLSPDSLFDIAHQDAVVDGHIRISGTSASSPVVAGAAALLLEQAPQLSPDEVKARLVADADSSPGVPSVNAGAAVADDTDPGSAIQSFPPSRMDWFWRVLWRGDGSAAVWDKAHWSQAHWSQAHWSQAHWAQANWAQASWARIAWVGDDD